MHVKLTLSYVGTNFRGFQTLAGARTIQGELERAISAYSGTKTAVVAAGRTDAGVHANGQVVGFLLPQNLAQLPTESLLRDLNNIFPPDIRAKKIEIMDKFNARQAAKSKTYIYKTYFGKPDRSRDLFYLRLLQKPNITNARTLAKQFSETSNFSHLCPDPDRNPICNISIDISQRNGDEIWLTFIGDRFLKHMVRILTAKILCLNTTIAPPRGLTLENVGF